MRTDKISFLGALLAVALVVFPANAFALRQALFTLDHSQFLPTLLEVGILRTDCSSEPILAGFGIEGSTSQTLTIRVGRIFTQPPTPSDLLTQDSFVSDVVAEFTAPLSSSGQYIAMAQEILALHPNELLYFEAGEYTTDATGAPSYHFRGKQVLAVLAGSDICQ